MAKYGKTKQIERIEHEYPVIELISQDSLDTINRLMGTHYTRTVSFRKISVKRNYSFDYLKKLMLHRPGIDREDEKN